MRNIYLFLVFLLFSQLYGQEELMYKDHVYQDYIKSVKFHHRGLYVSLPAIDLNSSGILELSFDDMDGGDREYRSYITHCDKDWNPSDLEDIEYLDGFNGEVIDDIYYAFGTYVDYSHYRLAIPNEDFDFLISGNYIVSIYDETDEKELVITRRFMVVEPKVSISAFMRKPSNSEKYYSHQEVDVTVNVNKFRIVDPLSEIELTILQNHRWDNAIHGIKPRYNRRDDLIFSYIDQLNFPAYNEFRFADIRSTKFVGQGIHAIDINKEGTDVLMQIDRYRDYNEFLSYNDLNGNYIVETKDQKLDYNLLDRTNNVTGNQSVIIDNQIKADYLNVIFTLDIDNYKFDAGVYLIGQFSDWELKPAYKLEYDHNRELYIGEALLKQGFYDYYYAIDDGETIDIEAIESSWHETENEYTILVYYREFGAPYDRLISLYSINSDAY